MGFLLDMVVKIILYLNSKLGEQGKNAETLINKAHKENENLKKLQTKQNKTKEDLQNIYKLEQILANIDSQIIAVYNAALQLSYDNININTHKPD